MHQSDNQSDKISQNQNVVVSTTNSQIEVDDERIDWRKMHYQKQSFERMMYEKLNHLQSPLYDLMPIKLEEKKFSNRSRLYVGNIPSKMSEQDLKNLLNTYGETNDLFFNKEKNFAFVKYDSRSTAETAKSALNGKFVKGKSLKVRFAPNNSTLKIKNLDEHVTDELLYAAFSIFGEIERCNVLIDDKGKTTGEGLVEFEKKSCAKFAYQKCKEENFLITSNIRPVIVEFHNTPDESEGFTEKSITKKGPEYYKSRSLGPRFTKNGSFEHDNAILWKQLYDIQRQKEEALKIEFEDKTNRLRRQIEMARYEQETAALREELRSREEQMERQKRKWEMRHQQIEIEKKRNDDNHRLREDNYRFSTFQRDYEEEKTLQENNFYGGPYQLNCTMQDFNYENVYESDSRKRKRL